MSAASSIQRKEGGFLLISTATFIEVRLANVRDNPKLRNVQDGLSKSSFSLAGDCVLLVVQKPTVNGLLLLPLSGIF